MKKRFLTPLALIAVGAAYLGLMPVPIDPVAWEPPLDAGHVGDFAPNTELANLERISVGVSAGPEDLSLIHI